MTTLDHDLRQVLAELELVSHVSAVNLDPLTRETSGEGIGGKRPPGGVDRADDREREYTLKSVEHFKRRLARARTVEQRQAILADAEDALKAFRRQETPKEPTPDDPLFKRYVAESSEKANVLAKRYAMPRQQIERIRREYTPPEPRQKPLRIEPAKNGCSNCGSLDCPPDDTLCAPCLEFQHDREQAGDPFDREAA